MNYNEIMMVKGAILKVSNLKRSVSFFTSLFMEEPVFSATGIACWKNGMTAVNNQKWKELFLFSEDEVSIPSTSIILEVSSFDILLKTLSQREDRASIVLDEKPFGGKRCVKIIDPDMNILVFVEAALKRDGEGRKVLEKKKHINDKCPLSFSED